MPSILSLCAAMLPLLLLLLSSEDAGAADDDALNPRSRTRTPGSVPSATVEIIHGAISGLASYSVPSGRFAATANMTCDFERSLVISYPRDLAEYDPSFSISTLQLRAEQLMVDAINTFPACGVGVGGKRYALSLRVYGHDNDWDKAGAIAEYAADPEGGNTDFFFGPYLGFNPKLGKVFTDQVARVANDSGKVMIGAGTAIVEVYRNRPTAFSIVSPPHLITPNAVPLLAKAGARTVHVIHSMPAGMQRTCASFAQLAAEHGMEVIGTTRWMSAEPKPEEYDALARNLSRPEADPDVVINCVMPHLCGQWVKAMRRVGWSPRMQVFHLCIGLDSFEEEVGTDFEHMMGMTAWHDSFETKDAVTGWSASEFAQIFEAYSMRPAQYNAPRAAGAVSVLVQAIERADSLDADRIVQELKTGTFETLFGNVSFDADGMNQMLWYATQCDTSGSLVHFDPANVEDDVRSAKFLYPMPTWEHRDCVKLSTCGRSGGDDNATTSEYPAGTCLPDGTCQCTDPSNLPNGIGATAECLDVPNEEMNFIADALLITGMALVAVQVVVGLSFIGWTVFHWSKNIVKASQPVFLVLICVGSILTMSSIIPTTIQGEYRYEQDPITGDLTDTPNNDIRKADAACMAFPWLFCVGFAATYSALFAKIWRVRLIVNSAQSFRRVKVEVKDVAGVMIVLLSVEVVVLLAWQLVDPLRWTRDVLRTNLHGFPTESRGYCSSENPLPYLITLASVKGGCLLYALYLCYVTRNVPSDLSEGKWITASVVSLLQILLLAIPILVIVQTSNGAFFFVRAGVVFLLSMSVSCFIFVPKITKLHRADIEGVMRRLSSTVIGRDSIAVRRSTRNGDAGRGSRRFTAAGESGKSSADRFQGNDLPTLSGQVVSTFNGRDSIVARRSSEDRARQKSSDDAFQDNDLPMLSGQRKEPLPN